MQDLKVILVQADQVWEDKQTNFKNYERLLENQKESDLILLPEMFQTAFSMNALQLAETMNDSESILWLQKIASTQNCALYTSMIVEESGCYYNRGMFVYPNGEIKTYDKRKRFGMAGEDQVFSQGDEIKIVNYKGWKFMLQICYDLRFPEIVRNHLDQEGKPIYDCILYVANWPERRIEHWKTLLKARAIENQCYVLGVNRVGKDSNGLDYSGDSAVINPIGTTIFELHQEEGLLITDLSNDELFQVRKSLPFLKDI